MFYNHICTLPDQEVNMSKSSQRLFNLIQISTKHPRTKYYFRSVAAIYKERKKHASLKYKWIIHPLSIIRFYYEMFMLIILYTSLFVTPLNLMVIRPNPLKTDPLDVVTFFVDLEIFCDLMLLFDVCMTLSTGVCRPRKHEILLQPNQIFRYQIKQFKFYLYFVCCTPSYLITRTISNFIPEFRFSRIAKGIEFFGAAKTLRLVKFLDYYDNTSEIFKHHHYTRMTLKYSLIIPAIVHSLTGIYLVVKEAVLIYGPLKQVIGPSLHIRFILEFSYTSIYFIGFETVTSYLLGIANQNGHRTNSQLNLETEHGLLLFLVISALGYFFCNFLFVLILEMLLSMNSSSIKYNEIMSQLRRYLVHKDLPTSINSRILSYYDYRFQKRYFRETSILDMLSETLRREINLHSCRKLIDSVPLLRDLPTEIISEVVGNLNHEVFLYNDIIVKAGTVGDCMYFIANGSVSVSTPTGKEICHLQDGAYFGEIALIAKDQKRVANVVAIEICEIYRLDRKNFRMCFPANSMFFKKIEQVARERMEKTALLEQLHKKYVLERSSKKNTYLRKVSISRDAL